MNIYTFDSICQHGNQILPYSMCFKKEEIFNGSHSQTGLGLVLYGNSIVMTQCRHFLSGLKYCFPGIFLFHCGSCGSLDWCKSNFIESNLYTLKRSQALTRFQLINTFSIVINHLEFNYMIFSCLEYWLPFFLQIDNGFSHCKIAKWKVDDREGLIPFRFY